MECTAGCLRSTILPGAGRSGCAHSSDRSAWNTCLSRLSCAHITSGSTPGIFGPQGYPNWYPLPTSDPPAGGLPGTRVPSRGFPGSRAGVTGDPFIAHVCRTDRESDRSCRQCGCCLHQPEALTLTVDQMADACPPWDEMGSFVPALCGAMATMEGSGRIADRVTPRHDQERGRCLSRKPLILRLDRAASLSRVLFSLHALCPVLRGVGQ